MNQNSILKPMLMLGFILFSTPLWAQKQLAPVVRGLGKNTLKAVPAVPFAGAVKPVQVAAPFSYVPPVRLKPEQLESLSARVEQRVHLLRAGTGTLRSLEELTNFALQPGSKELRMQALALATNFTESEARLFLSFYPFLTGATKFSLENNEWLLQISPSFKKQLIYLQQYREDILAALQITQLDRPHQLVNTIGPDRQLIMVGEVHNRPNQREQLVALLKQYRAKYPKRKMVLFSEFLPSRHPHFWQPGQAIPADFFEKNPEFSNEVYQLGKSLNMEIYGLEDLDFTYRATQAMSGLDFVAANTSFRIMPVRNKYWEGIIRYVMKETRKTDPDAVFFVYAGNAHIDKSIFESLSAMMKDENPFALELRNGYQNGFLGFLLGKNPSWLAELPNPYLMTWSKGKDFSQQIGFDAQVILPFRPKEEEK